jgi:beta-ribofuranosylaminobenzene 5'-phosphate synthase
LLDLGNATLRKYGGAGFCIGGPPVEIEVAPSRETKIFGLEQVDSQGSSEVRRALGRLKAFLPHANAKVFVRNVPPQHIGLGTKTALILAVLKAVDLAVGPGLPAGTLQTLSRRGGTSGIGVNGFFMGGFLVDAGHDPGRSKGFAPSSDRTAFSVPPVVCRLSIPSKWRFHLMLPPGYRSSGSRERRFFRENTPIAARDVLNAISLVYHGVAPAVLSQDLSMLKEALRGLHRLGFKREEVEHQSLPVQELLRSVNHEANLAAGMSSLGPLVYAVTDKGDINADETLSLLSTRYGARLLGCFPGRNEGFEVLD